MTGTGKKGKACKASIQVFLGSRPQTSLSVAGLGAAAASTAAKDLTPEQRQKQWDSLTQTEKAAIKNMTDAEMVSVHANSR